jgi:hypothetical protein
LVSSSIMWINFTSTMLPSLVKFKLNGYKNSWN